MSETIRVSGKTLEDAITNATIQLGVTSDNIVYTVIEHESRGFLGIGQKDAVIEVRAKTDADYETERIVKKAEEDAAAVANADSDAVNDTVNETVSDDESSKNTDYAEDLEAESLSPASDAGTAGPLAGQSEEPAAADADQAPRRHHEREIKPLEHPEEAIAKAEDFLRNVYQAMGMDVELVSDYDGESLNIEMNGDDMGILIGKRGQTLDSLQYLVSLVVNKESPTYVRVKLDTENYRERRKATLENLAKNIAVKVKKTRQSVWLEPMNPYERRIIHSALQGDPFVTTYSEGEEPNRKVVVALKKDADLDALERKYGERRSRHGYRGSRGKGTKGNGKKPYRQKDESYQNEDSFENEETEYIEAVEIPDIGADDNTNFEPADD